MKNTEKTKAIWEKALVFLILGAIILTLLFKLIHEKNLVSSFIEDMVVFFDILFLFGSLFGTFFYLVYLKLSKKDSSRDE